jgi:hypothetical protein
MNHQLSEACKMITGRAITALPLLLLDVINFSIPSRLRPFTASAGHRICLPVFSKFLRGITCENFIQNYLARFSSSSQINLYPVNYLVKDQRSALVRPWSI